MIDVKRIQRVTKLFREMHRIPEEDVRTETFSFERFERYQGNGQNEAVVRVCFHNYFATGDSVEEALDALEAAAIRDLKKEVDRITAIVAAHQGCFE